MCIISRVLLRASRGNPQPVYLKAVCFIFLVVECSQRINCQLVEFVEITLFGRMFSFAVGSKLKV